MPYSRRRSDGTHEKNAILRKIYTDFGALSPLCMSYKNPLGMTYSKSSFPLSKSAISLPWEQNVKPSSPPRTADAKKVEPYKPSGTPRYSKIDKFIDNLNEACKSLPKPLVEDFGRVRPQTVQSQPKREVTYRVKVKESQPVSVRTQGFVKAPACEGERRDERGVSREDSKRLGPMESGVIPPLRLPQINMGNQMSPEMPWGPWNTPDDGRKRDCESRQSAQLANVCSDALGSWKNAEDVKRDRETEAAKVRSEEEERAFESKKRMEVVKAATMLQSRYRGYKVRRSQPLKYMLMIGSAKNKLQELKQQFNAWKIAVWFPTDYSERLGMLENVTNLLAKLESIQSVPLYIREFRKSVARDVIKFQEEVDAFLRHNNKHGALFNLAGSENHSRTQRPKSRTERRSGSGSRVKDSVCCNEHPTTWKTVELSSTLQREFAAMENFTDASNSDESHSAVIGEIEDCETDSDDSVQCDQLEPSLNQLAPKADLPSEAAAAAVDAKVNVALCPPGSVKPENGAGNEINCDETNPTLSVVGTETSDIFIPQRGDSSRNSRRKKYGVRFEDVIDQTEMNTGVQPCSVTEQDLTSSEEESSPHNATSLSNGQCNVAFSKCSDERRELTDVHEQRHQIFPSSETAISVPESPECLTTDAGDGTETREENSQHACSGTLHEQAPATRCITVHVHNSEPLANKSSGFSEEADCVDSKGDVNVQGRLKHQALMADIRNASVNRFGDFGAASPPPRTRFHSEQSLLRSTSADGALRPDHRHAKYEGSCSSSGNSSDTESSDAIDEIEEEHEGQVPSNEQEQNQSGTFAGNDSEDRAFISGSQVQRNCADFQSMRMPPNNTFDDRTSNAEADMENESEVESVGGPEVENVSCCSDCARRPGQHAFECWNGAADEEESLRRHPCNEFPREVQEEYVPLDYQHGERRDDYCRPTERFDHRELRYFADPYTQKLRRVKQAAPGRTSQNDYTSRPDNSRLLQKPPSAQHVTKRVAHKMTSVTPSPTQSICSETDRSPSRSLPRSSPPRSRCQSPYRLTPDSFASDGRKALQRDERPTHDRSLLTKLVDDNKRLKALLKDVMHWNKSQSTAMVSMSERIEHLEGLNILT